MKKFQFSFFRAHVSDGREGVVMFSWDCDHITPMRVINAFLGEDVLELNGNGIGVNLFLPESKLDAWQKLAMFDEAWNSKFDDKQKAEIDLEILRKRT